jgi:hypothetical protein
MVHSVLYKLGIERKIESEPLMRNILCLFFLYILF